MEHRPFDLYRKVVPCTAAEVLAFHSARKEFIPGVPGHVIEVTEAFAFKPAGPAFVVTLGNFIQGRYNNTAKLSVVSLGVTGFLDVTVPSSGFTRPGGITLVTGDEANVADAAGKSIVSGTNNNADYTGEGSPITLVFLYRLIPTTADGVAAVTDANPIGRF